MKNKFSYIQNEFANLLSICDIRHVLHAWLRMRFCREYPQRVGCVCLLGPLFVLFSQTTISNRDVITYSLLYLVIPCL
jgi:hypothetical protein